MSNKENTGSRNTGNRNTGNFNKGSYNTGSLNLGSFNTGSLNLGTRNTGTRNMGSYNTGSFNTGSYNTGYCNTETPKVRLFNADSEIVFGSDAEVKIYRTISKYQKPLCEWVSASIMTKEEKQNNKTWEITQGYLKVNETIYNGNDVTKEDEEYFRSLPNFDEEIFKICTGIDLSNMTVKIIIDGKEIQISKEEFENIKAQFLNNKKG